MTKRHACYQEFIQFMEQLAFNLFARYELLNFRVVAEVAPGLASHAEKSSMLGTVADRETIRRLATKVFIRAITASRVAPLGSLIVWISSTNKSSTDLAIVSFSDLVRTSHFSGVDIIMLLNFAFRKSW
ncbi:hypothetical protein OGAPHI_003950 [Ogataea philodendri]|uniref:Uncharacterized protein n=1 Tax=Ogataea philodendri TaxID=1378263 RepID=A0A9P8P5S4_9ASCO|nr:uncharacterized protein OGAPHI_003950 [Ogataea philodendri]KAH3665762.1 hypothetical protein OGAPHI_003950 [Ogataea philodendri]